VIVSAVYRLYVQSEGTKTEVWGCLSQKYKHVFGIGKGKWRMLEGEEILSLDKKPLIYNPTIISLPIKLQTPPTYTFQFFKPHKHTPLCVCNKYLDREEGGSTRQVLLGRCSHTRLPG
jgi:hypothetical protein